MNHDELQKKLEGLELPEVELLQHKRLLLMQLEQAPQRSRWAMGIAKFTRMISSHKYAFGTLTAAVALAVVAVAFNFFNLNATPHAQAQDALKRTMKFADKMTPEQRAQIEEKIQADLKQTLEEAYNAPDLKILTPEEFNAEFNSDAALNPKLDRILNVRMEHMKAKGEEGPKTDSLPAKLFSMKAFKPGNDDVTKYLRYTDAEGRAVTLGVDKDDNVLFKAIKFSESDMQKKIEAGGMHMIDPANAGEFGFAVGGKAEAVDGDVFAAPVAGSRVFFNERID
jgi:hypothetical protein